MNLCFRMLIDSKLLGIYFIYILRAISANNFDGSKEILIDSPQTQVAIRKNYKIYDLKKNMS